MKAILQDLALKGGGISSLHPIQLSFTEKDLFLLIYMIYIYYHSSHGNSIRSCCVDHLGMVYSLNFGRCEGSALLGGVG